MFADTAAYKGKTVDVVSWVSVWGLGVREGLLGRLRLSTSLGQWVLYF